MKNTFATVAAVLLALSTSHAQISLTGSNYMQDFDSLPASEGISTLPFGWAFLETGSAADGAFTAGDGSSRKADTFNYGTVASSDRALGTRRNRKLVSTFVAWLKPKNIASMMRFSAGENGVIRVPALR